MAKITLRVNGEQVPFHMPEPGTGPSVFVFAPPKSGSTFLNHLISDLTKYGPQPNVNIPSALFDSGINFQTAQLERADLIFGADGYCFSGFRDWPRFLGGSFDLNQYKRVFMMRDPRDMLVSNYYSMARSHPIPEKGKVKDQMEEKRFWAQKLNIDEYVLGEPSEYYRNLLDRMVRIWDTPTVSVGLRQRQHRHERKRTNLLKVRYEDVVFEKVDFAKRLCEFFDWGLDERLVTEAATKQDVFPKSERPDEHIRQVKPGNFREKLKPETILQLNETFAPYLRIFGYDETL